MDSKVVVLTRSMEGNEELSARLLGLGLSPVAVDTIAFSPPSDWTRVDSLLRGLSSFDWLLLTSATGVRFFAHRAGQLGIAIPWSGKPRVGAVGPKTADALAASGAKAEFVPSSYLTSALARELPSDEGLRVLLLRADIADEGLVGKLEERGFEVEAAAVYSTVRPPGGNHPDLSGARFVLFASPSAVRGLCSLLGPGELSELRSAKALCIGPVTEAEARERGFENTALPPVYTLESLVDELARLSRDPS